MKTFVNLILEFDSRGTSSVVCINIDHIVGIHHTNSSTIVDCVGGHSYCVQGTVRSIVDEIRSLR